MRGQLKYKNGMEMDEIFSGEYFEITIFTHKAPNIFETVCKLLNLREGENFIREHDIPFLRGKNILLGVYDNDAFTELELNIPHFTIEEKSFMEFIVCLSDMANRLCKSIKEISFITCVYELTGYLDREAKRLSDYNEKILSQFPIVFYPTNKKLFSSPSFFFDAVSCNINSVSCSFKYNGEGQDIFSKPGSV